MANFRRSYNNVLNYKDTIFTYTVHDSYTITILLYTTVCRLLTHTSSLCAANNLNFRKFATSYVTNITRYDYARTHIPCFTTNYGTQI